MSSDPQSSDLLATSFEPLASRYDVIFCDVWGVLHDGLTPFAGASDALSRFREGGGTVILISNAPRPGTAVEAQLGEIGVPKTVWDSIVTSGDLAREAIRQRADQVLYHLGPPRDRPLFDGLNLRFGDLSICDYVVCSGLFDDDRETADDYREALSAMRGRDLWMLCANPDLVVERGDRLIPCAGALAAAYEDLGGEVYYPGKPHRPVYEAARIEAGRLRGAVPDLDRILAVGDAIPTDIRGAAGFGIDSLLVARGIHAADLYGPDGRLDRARSFAWLATQAAQPTAVTDQLVWRLEAGPA
jgi:HAD superfamily hydrolase (TIGR01459 family)